MAQEENKTEKSQLNKITNENHQLYSFEEHDKLDRGKIAKMLTTLLENTESNYVLNINSAWGTGKTFFLNCWKKSLDEKKISIYFNAWQNDYHENAFEPIFATISQNIKSKIPDKVYNGLVKNGGKIIINGLKGYFTNKIGSDAIDEITEAFGFSIVNAAVRKEKDLQEFKKILEEASKKSSNKKIFIFVDELDRCKPTFAVEVLEKVKHFFDVPNVIFVIASSNTQLEATIKAAYGESFDSREYLKRFFDLSVNLPEPNYKNFTDLLFKRYTFNEENFFTADKRLIQVQESRGDLTCTAFVFCELSQIFTLSLRSQQQCFSQVYLILNSLEFINRLNDFLVVFLVMLKHSQADFYENLHPKLLLSEMNIQKLLNDYPLAEEIFVKSLKHSSLNIITLFSQIKPSRTNLINAEKPFDIWFLSQTREIDAIETYIENHFKAVNLSENLLKYPTN